MGESPMGRWPFPISLKERMPNTESPFSSQPYDRQRKSSMGAAAHLSVGNSYLWKDTMNNVT